MNQILIIKYFKMLIARIVVVLITLPLLSLLKPGFLTASNDDYFKTPKEICNENGFGYEEH